MSIRNIILLLLAIGSSAGTGFAVMNFLDQQKIQAEVTATQNETVVVEEKASMLALVATSDLHAGQFIRAEDMEWLPWPEAAAHERFITLSGDEVENEELADKEIDQFKGGVVHKPVLKGQPVQLGQIVFPGDRGFLAAVMNPGMKAVSVSIKKEAGVSGLIFPGDRVDVLVALKLKGTDVKGDNATRFVSTTMLEDVRVLAIDQTFTVGDDEEAIPGKTATLEVSEEQARKVSVARTMGQISLALRSLAEPEEKNDEEMLFAAASGAASSEKTTEAVKRNYTLDTEVFTVNGRDMSMVIGSRKRSNDKKADTGVVVLRGNKSASEQ